MASNLLSQARDLQRRKARRRRAATVIEGLRLLEEALDAGVPVRGALAVGTFGDQPREAALLQQLAERAIPVDEVSPRQLVEIADTQTPQGIVAIVEVAQRSLRDLEPKPHTAVLVLDGVQDPGNVGALLRTAWALGAPGVIALDGTADITSPKVSRAAMGATFHLPVVTAALGELVAWTREHDTALWVADTEGTPLGRLTPPDRLVLAVGNEGAGVRPELHERASARVAIPLAGGAESLNVVVAAGIVLYEVAHA